MALGMDLKTKFLPPWPKNAATAPPSYRLQWLDRNVGQRLAMAAAQGRNVKRRIAIMPSHSGGTEG